MHARNMICLTNHLYRKLKFLYYKLNGILVYTCMLKFVIEIFRIFIICKFLTIRKVSEFFVKLCIQGTRFLHLTLPINFQARTFILKRILWQCIFIFVKIFMFCNSFTMYGTYFDSSLSCFTFKTTKYILTDIIMIMDCRG